MPKDAAAAADMRDTTERGAVRILIQGACAGEYTESCKEVCDGRRRGGLWSGPSLFVAAVGASCSCRGMAAMEGNQGLVACDTEQPQPQQQEQIALSMEYDELSNQQQLLASTTASLEPGINMSVNSKRAVVQVDNQRSQLITREERQKLIEYGVQQGLMQQRCDGAVVHRTKEAAALIPIEPPRVGASVSGKLLLLSLSLSLSLSLTEKKAWWWSSRRKGAPSPGAPTRACA